MPKRGHTKNDDTIMNIMAII